MDPTQLLNAIMGGGVRGGSPLGSALDGMLGGGRSAPGGSPLGGLLGGLLGGGRGTGAGTGGLEGLAGMLGGRGGGSMSNDMLGQLAGAALGGAFGARAGGGLGGAAGMAVVGGLAARLLQSYLAKRGDEAPAPEQLATQMIEADPATLNSKAMLYVRAMIEAAKADGQIDGAERQAILGKIAASGCGAEEQAFLEQMMAAPQDIDGLVAAVGGDRQTAAEVLTASMLAIEADTEAEKQYLKHLAERLGLGGAFG
jgi:uncharacterized membrane protein YebE (DUF533 family)